MRPSEGRHKYEVLVRYLDPEEKRTKRDDGSRQKIIKFGQKGQVDYIDNGQELTRQKNTQRVKMNKDNPLHINFYNVNILNGQYTDPFENF